MCMLLKVTQHEMDQRAKQHNDLLAGVWEQHYDINELILLSVETEPLKT